MREHKVSIPLFLCISIIAAMGLTVYFNSFYNGFVWDDRHLILENPLVRKPDIFKVFIQDLVNTDFSKTLFYRPMQNLSYIADYGISGLDPVGFHLTNTIIHIANSILVFFLVLALAKNRILSLLTSVLFVSHPVHYAVVTYISGRADSLFTGFFLISFLAFIRYREDSNTGFLLASSAGFILSLLSKETAAISVFIFVLYDIIFRKAPLSLKRTFLPYLAFIIPLALYGALRLFRIGELNPLIFPGSDLYEYLITFPEIIARYLTCLAAPFDLYMGKSVSLATTFFSPKVLASAAMVLLIVFLAFRLKGRNKGVSFFMLYFFITLIPVSNMIIRVNAPLADHWLYMPSIGYFFIISYCLVAVFNVVFKGRLKRGAFVLGICLTFIYASVTVRQNAFWRDEVTLFTEILRHRPGDPVARSNLALAYLDKGDTQKALDEARKVMESSPDYARGHYGAGIILFKMGDYDEALGHFKSAVEKDADFDEPHIYLGLIYENRKEYAEARSEFEKYIKLSPYSALGYVNMGILMYDQNEIDGAFDFFNAALERDPGNTTACLYLGAIYRDKKDFAAALRLLEKAYRIEPGNVGILMDLGNMYNSFGQFDKAIGFFEKAIIISPENSALYYNIGTSYWLKDDVERAKRYWRRALDINPAFTAAKDRLGELEKAL
ncbi:MAG: hypothetical protein A2Z72_03650 [Omnitrophica bacterium RBG_13_46_9]|nr:MAG: hypothetical protein A2Z72_03650 [Omnitrophica bacterium RBG_13_46_9]